MTQENKNKIVAAVNICRMFLNLHNLIIGGSAAMLAQGLAFRDELKDVDVIVTPLQLTLIEKLAKLYEWKPAEHSSYSKNHACYNVFDSVTIDFVAGDVEDIIIINKVTYQDLNTIFKTKRKWARPKDIRDCNWVIRAINKKFNTRLMWDDLDEIHWRSGKLYVTALNKVFVLE